MRMRRIPCKRRVGKVRRTAQMLDQNTRASAEACWTRAVSHLRRSMQWAGIAAERIEREVLAFREAVRAELNRRSRGANRVHSSGGDAA